MEKGWMVDPGSAAGWMLQFPKRQTLRKLVWILLVPAALVGKYGLTMLDFRSLAGRHWDIVVKPEQECCTKGFCLDKSAYRIR